MAKPPPSTPHSDMEGVHRDEKPNTATAQETGETSADLERAHDRGKGRPRYEDEKKAG